MVSAAFAYRQADGTVGKMFHVEHSAVLSQLCAIPDDCKIVVHNYQFEYGVLAHCFPGHEGRVSCDTMRLVQVADNGGKLMAVQPKVESEDDLLDSVESRDPSPGSAGSRVGLGLVASASRWLPVEWQDHKAPYHAWLREHKGVKKGQEGAHLTLLPADMFEAYNVADAEVTLRLYETLTEKLAAEGYDWTLDHELYKSTARMVAMAKGRGVRVNVAALKAYEAQVQEEVNEMTRQFRAKYAVVIAELEEARIKAWIYGVARTSAQARRELGLAEDDSLVRLNLSSTKQLKELFVDKLGVQPRFWTKEPHRKAGFVRKKEFVPQPSFKSAHLSTYGEGGEMLRNRRKRLLVLQQVRALIKLAALDGRWHADLRAAGTATGRLAGGR